MRTRFASALLALTLPLAAQTPTPAPAPVPAADAVAADGLFYKAFYLEKTHDIAGAMDLYQKFLDAAPEHKHAAEAAKSQLALLDKTGKSKERDAFKAKYEKQLAMKTPNVAGERAGGDRPADGEGARGDRPQPGAGGERRPGAGQGRPGMAGMAVLYGDKKVADMTDEEKGQVKEALGMSSRMVERLRQAGEEDKAKKIEDATASLKKALDEGKNDDAQKALDVLRAERPARRGAGGEGGGRGRGGEGGGQGGGNRGGGGEGGGQGGGNRGGGDR